MPNEQDRRRTVGRREEDRWTKWDKRIRDLVIFLIGIGALVNELFLKEEPNTTILLFLLGMVGVPFALRADEIRRGHKP